MLYCSSTDGSTTASCLGHSAIIRTCSRLRFSCFCTLKSIHLHTRVHTHSHSHTCTLSPMNTLTWNDQTGNPTPDFLLTAGCQCYICGFHFSLLGDILCHYRILLPNEKSKRLPGCSLIEAFQVNKYCVEVRFWNKLRGAVGTHPQYNYKLQVLKTSSS